MDSVHTVHAAAQREFQPARSESDKKKYRTELGSIRNAVLSLNQKELESSDVQADLFVLSKKLEGYDSGSKRVARRVRQCRRAIDEINGDATAFFERMERTYGPEIVKTAKSFFSIEVQREREQPGAQLLPEDRGQFVGFCRGIRSTRKHNREANHSFRDKLLRHFSEPTVDRAFCSLSDERQRDIESGAVRLTPGEQEAIRIACETTKENSHPSTNSKSQQQ